MPLQAKQLQPDMQKINNSLPQHQMAETAVVTRLFLHTNFSYAVAVNE